MFKITKGIIRYSSATCCKLLTSDNEVVPLQFPG